MTNDQKHTDRDISSFPPRSKVHGGSEKKRQKKSHKIRNKNSTDGDESVQVKSDEAVETDAPELQVDESTTYAYRRPERKRPNYLLVKIWLVLFLLIVIGMVTFPLWEEWFSRII